MTIIPLSNTISPLNPIESKINPPQETVGTVDVAAPTFLDVFKNIVKDAQETNAQKSQDMIALMLGEVDDLETIQANIAKAEIATELLVTVKNSVVDAYNEIIRMNI